MEGAVPIRNDARSTSIYTDREELECETEALKEALKASQEEAEEKDKRIEALDKEVEWFVKQNPRLDELERQMRENKHILTQY